jgi:hypothetical protein
MLRLPRKCPARIVWNSAAKFLEVKPGHMDGNIEAAISRECTKSSQGHAGSKRAYAP